MTIWFSVRSFLKPITHAPSDKSADVENLFDSTGRL